MYNCMMGIPIAHPNLCIGLYIKSFERLTSSIVVVCTLLDEIILLPRDLLYVCKVTKKNVN